MRKLHYHLFLTQNYSLLLMTLSCFPGADSRWAVWWQYVWSIDAPKIGSTDAMGEKKKLKEVNILSIREPFA